MKSSIIKYAVLLVTCGLLFFYQSCKKKEDSINHKYGLFPETLVKLDDLNKVIDNSDISKHVIEGNIALIFPNSDKNDLKQGAIPYIFDQVTGDIRLAFDLTNDVFTKNIISKAVAQGNNSVPYRFFCTIDGFEYFISSYKNASGNSDFFYLKNLPVYEFEIQGPFPTTLLNSTANDDYISFNQDFSAAYFSSDREGKFNIYTHPFSLTIPLSDQLKRSFIASVKLDNLNSSENDICPFEHKDVMIFASDRLGGLGGFDLYYSVFKDDKWSAPINFGPGINTEFDEYMPILGSVTNFKNSYLIFSSNREGNGDYDLYFTGINLPK